MKLLQYFFLSITLSVFSFDLECQKINFISANRIENIKLSGFIFNRDINTVKHIDSFIYLLKNEPRSMDKIFVINGNSLKLVDSLKIKWPSNVEKIIQYKRKNSKSCFLLRSNNLAIAIFNTIYLFEKAPDNSFNFISESTYNGISIDEILVLENKSVIVVGKSQMKDLDNGGVILTKLSLKTGKIKVQKTLNSNKSAFFFFEKNNSYFSCSNSEIFVHKIDEPKVLLFDFNLKLIDSLILPFTFSNKVYDFRFLFNLYKGSMQLLDTVQSIAKNADKIESIISNAEGNCILRIQIKEDSLFQNKLLFCKNKVVTEFEKTQYDDSMFFTLFCNNYSTFDKDFIYIWHGFGNILITDTKITKDIATQKYLTETPYPAVYVFKIVY